MKYQRLFSKPGKVAHFTPYPFDQHGDPRIRALCGFRPMRAWLGTGSAEEDRKAARLPRCELCYREALRLKGLAELNAMLRRRAEGDTGRAGA